MPINLVVQRNQNMLNVKDYGAQGNNLNDDTVAINATIAALPSGGGTVFFPPGTYLISSTIVITSDNVQLIGAGWNTIIKPLNNTWQNSYLIKVAQPPQTSGSTKAFRFGFMMSNLALYGSNNAGFGGIELDSTYHALIEHCLISYFPAISIYLNGPDGGYGNVFGAYTTIRKCNIANGGGGHAIETNCHEWNTIDDCMIAWYNTAANVGTGRGVYSTGSANRIINTAFDECDIAIHIYYARGNTIQSCGFDRGLVNFVVLQGAINTRVIGNAFQDFAGTGSQSMILAEDGQNSNNLIADNICEQGHAWVNFVSEATSLGTQTLTQNPIPGNFYVNNRVGTYAIAKQAVSTWRGNTGYNPVGKFTSPTVPTSGTVYTNAFGLDCTVFVIGGTVTAISVGGNATGLTSTNTSVRVLAGQTITLSYTAAPTWNWFGD